MDYISATFVYWFKMSLFHSVLCPVPTSMYFVRWNFSVSLVLGASVYSHLVIISGFRQFRAARGSEEDAVSCSVLLLPLAGEGKADFGVIYCLSCLFLKEYF